MGYKLTGKGIEKAEKYIKELKAKRKEILGIGLSTANKTNIPSIEDIEEDIDKMNLGEDEDYIKVWNVTDTCIADYALRLSPDDDFEEELEEEFEFD